MTTITLTQASMKDFAAMGKIDRDKDLFEQEKSDAKFKRMAAIGKREKCIGEPKRAAAVAEVLYGSGDKEKWKRSVMASAMQVADRMDEIIPLAQEYAKLARDTFDKRVTTEAAIKRVVTVTKKGKLCEATPADLIKVDSKKADEAEEKAAKAKTPEGRVKAVVALVEKLSDLFDEDDVNDLLEVVKPELSKLRVKAAEPEEVEEPEEVSAPAAEPADGPSKEDLLQQIAALAALVAKS